MTLKFNISVKPGLIGKDVDMSGVWDTRQMTPRELAQWSFFDHTGYCHGVFDADEYRRNPQHYKTSKANAFFLFAEVITVDIDSKDLTDEQKAQATIELFLENEFIRRHCFMITPSSGNIHVVKPNWHLSFKLNKPVTDVVEYRRLALALHTQIGLPCDHQTAKAAQPTMGTLYKDPDRHAGGYKEEDLYVNEYAEPVDVDFLDSLTPDAGSRLEVLVNAQKTKVEANNYELTDTGNKRVAAHFAQALEAREKVVIECLSHVLPALNDETTYDQWLQVWMSAHHGAPTEKVRDYIVSHPAVHWSDKEIGKAKFIHAFNTHVHSDSGFSVASLFYLAIKAGWLSKTGYEIPEHLAEKIDVDHIPNWLEGQTEIPNRVLMESQTGSGKTQAFKTLFKRLGEPKTVVFVPSIKLAAELATELVNSGLPATLYMDIHTGKIASPTVLSNAKLLVTTLQSFAMKVHKGDKIMSDYGLVYIEESDQLLSQFARGGGGLYSTHVRDNEARAGFAVLRDAFQNSGVVWCLDATMTQVTWTVATAMSSQPVRYILNTWKRKKQPVKMVDERGKALQIVAKALSEGKRVAVAADTKDTAQEVADTMEKIGALDGKKFIVITKDTERLTEVKDFMTDVNKAAPQYDLIAYNSVMASGVSITSVAPDVIVQFCGYLTPRANLQMLNRFRLQKEVYCFYRTGENFYKKTAEEVYAEAHRMLDIEAKIVNVPMIERTDDAKLQDRARSISVGDEMLQERSPSEFYKALLRRDGREVRDIEAPPPSEKLKHTVKGVREARKERKAEVSKGWREVRAITQDDPADADMDDETVAKGVRHGEILNILNNYDPTDEEPEEVDRVVSMFEDDTFYLCTFARQDVAFRRAEAFLADTGRAILAIQNRATFISVTSVLRTLLHRTNETLTPDILEQRAEQFVSEMRSRKEDYDTIVSRDYHQFDQLAEKHADDTGKLAIAIAKVILIKMGLKLSSSHFDKKDGKKRRSYAIKNLEEANKFLAWRYHNRPENEPLPQLGGEFNTDKFDKRVKKNRDTMKVMGKLTPEQVSKVVDIMKNEKHTTFENAVIAAVDKGLI
jgi:hypothetical protein